MNVVFTHIKNNIGILLLVIFFGFLFFFRLNYNTLASWDEAWYASISREMVIRGDYLNMKWNGIPYYDHPPMGFWLMAASYKIFGINELTTRLPSAILGVLTIYFVYLTGKLISGKNRVGFTAALILGTCVWYVIRVRSGNLDSAFVFFYITSIYFSLKSDKDFRFFPLTAISAASLFMTKTLIGASVLPLILYINFDKLLNIRKNWRLVAIGIVSAAIIILPWYYEQYKTYSNFIQYHFFQIGSRSKTLASYFKLQWQEPMFYIHMGIRKWYYIWFIGIIGLFFAIFIKKTRRLPIFLLLWIIVVLYPFLTAEQTELWHLIPLYIPISIIIAYGLEIINPLGLIPYVAGFLIIAAIQIKTFYAEVIPANKYTPDDVAICQSASKYTQTVYLDDDFFPICVYYSNRRLMSIYSPATFGEDPELNTMVKLFKSDRKNFVVITRSWAVNNLEVEKIPHKILEKNGSFTIVSRP